MDSWSLLIGGLAGLALTLFGVRMLVTGQMPALIRRSFRTERHAALYHLLFGVGLLILVGGTFLPFRYGSSSAILIAAVIALVAVVKFRPRSPRADKKDEDAEERAKAAEERAKQAEERARNAEKLLADKSRRQRTQDRAAELLQAREAARARETGKK